MFRALVASLPREAIKNMEQMNLLALLSENWYVFLPLGSLPGML